MRCHEPSRLSEFRARRLFPDFALGADDAVFPVHRFFLASARPRVDRFLARDPGASFLRVAANGAHVEAFLAFVYGERVEGDLEALLGITILGCVLEVRAARDAGVQELRAQAAPESAHYVVRSLNAGGAWEASCELLPALAGAHAAGLVSDAAFGAALLPLNLRALFALPPFAALAPDDRFRLIDRVFGARAARLRPWEKAFLARFVDVEDRAASGLLLRYRCDWVPAALSRRPYAELLARRRDAAARADALHRGLAAARVAAGFVMQSIDAIQFCTDPHRERPLVAFLATLGSLLPAPCCPHALGFVDVSASTPAMARDYPATAFFQSAGHYLSRIGSPDDPPRLVLRFPAPVLMWRFTIVSDVRDAHARRRPPPAKMRCLVRSPEGSVAVVDPAIVFYEEKAWKKFKNPVGPFTEIAFEMVEPPEETATWNLRISGIEIMGKLLP
jgi:hypothetical protein